MPTQIIKTLDDIINRVDRYDINNVTYFTKTEDGTLIIPDKNVFDTYIRFVRPYVKIFQVEPKHRRVYQFHPHLLSLDVYGTPSLEWLILMLNDRECPSHFYLKSTVKLIPKEIISTVFNMVATREAEALERNRNKYLTQIGDTVEITVE